MAKYLTIVDKMKPYASPCVLAIGVFDGMHMGHRAVVKELLSCSAGCGGAKPCVLTFTPHPSEILGGGRPPVRMLYPVRERAKIFVRFGVDKVFVKNFTPDFASKPPPRFAEFLEKKFPKLKGIVTGKDFVFGAKAAGDWNCLKKLCVERGWTYRAVDGIMLSPREKMSSTGLRRALEKGDMQLYAKMTGVPYTCSGVVRRGKRMGGKLGYPTLNLPWNPDCKPPFGVYAVLVSKNGGESFSRGVANYGLAPTVGKPGRSPVLETHLFRAPSFGAGRRIEVRLVEFLRPEKKFDTLDALVRQISNDKATVRDFFKSRKEKQRALDADGDSLPCKLSKP